MHVLAKKMTNKNSVVDKGIDRHEGRRTNIETVKVGLALRKGGG